MTALLSDSLLFARRNAEHIRQIPEKLLDVTLQPIMFTLLFAYVFGGVIDVPGGDYKEYLVGGILVQSLGFGMMGPGVTIASDLTEGIIDRFRSLPTSRAAYLVGHLFSELAASLLALTILLGTGLVVGWRVNEDVLHGAAAVGLLIAFAMSMIMLGTLIGVIARSADGVQGIAFMTVFPLTFLSNAFVPAEGLPSGLRVVAEWNPFSAVVAAVRTLFGNPVATPPDAEWPLQHPVLAAVLWIGLIFAVVTPLLLRRFYARTSG